MSKQDIGDIHVVHEIERLEANIDDLRDSIEYLRDEINLLKETAYIHQPPTNGL